MLEYINMQNDTRMKLAVLLVSLILMLSVSCQKKTVAVENQSNSTAQQSVYETSTADQFNVAEKRLIHQQR